MKYVGRSAQAVVLALAVSLVGCNFQKNHNGGGGGSTSATATGAWHATLTSQVNGGSTTADLFISQSGSTLISPMVLLGTGTTTPCAAQGSMSGSVSSSNFTMNITESDNPPDSVAISGSASGTSATGTYTTTGTCTNGDHGTMSAIEIPTITSTAWTGSSASTAGHGSTTFTANVSENTGTGAVTMAFTFSGSGCLTQLTMNGNLIGAQLNVQDSGGLLTAGGTVDPTGKSISGTYTTGGVCAGDTGTFQMSTP